MGERRFATGHAASSVKVSGGSPTGFIKDLIVSYSCEGKGSVLMRESGPDPAPGSEALRE